VDCSMLRYSPLARVVALVLFAAAYVAPVPLSAQQLSRLVGADSSTRLSLGGFVDSYVAWDAGRPPALDRQLTTQAARHAEFNVNLAHVELGLVHPRVRGRFAAQFGTSVQANYAGEPRVGTLSGADVSRYVQEATAGVLVHPRVWVDGGVFFSPYGAESWISRDNWTYARSLIADNSPYYEAGVKATWQATRALTAQLHVMNGWQNISETNSDKALGVRLDYTTGERLQLGYALFAGNEQPDSVPGRARVFHEVIARTRVSPRLQLGVTVDRGTQQREGAGADVWHGGALLGRLTVTDRAAIGLRGEWYHDPAQVIVRMSPGEGLRATGGSVNLDVALSDALLWRTEYRHVQTRLAAFASTFRDEHWRRRNHVVVTSLALTL
jgi:hypothetical protein